MGIFRILFFVALVWLLYKLIQGLKPGPRVGGPRRPSRTTSPKLEGGELVQDPQCGVYIPAEGAVRGPDGHLFCSTECRDAYGARKD